MDRLLAILETGRAMFGVTEIAIYIHDSMISHSRLRHFNY